MARYCCTFIVIILSVIINIVTPLKCYVCSTVSKADKCEDYFNVTSHSVDECDSTDALCYKQILPAIGKSPVSTHRGCADPEYCKLYQSTSNYCSLCKDNFCNSSIKIQAPLISVVFICYLHNVYQSFFR